MTCLFFNDCLPDGKSLETYTAALLDTLDAYIHLAKQGHELCVVTSLHQDSLMIANDIYLKNCILSIPIREKRVFALRLFGKYPIGKYYDEMAFADKIVESPFFIDLDGKTKDATNLAIVAHAEGILFTLGVSDPLRKDRLELHSAKGSISVLNLYGEDVNTDCINDILIRRADEQKDLLSRILDCIKGEAYSSFVDHFSAISHLSKESILSAFKTARKEDKLFPVHTDNKLLKDVTPDKGKKGRLYELRIYSPIALRVYFYQKNDITYLVDLCGKAGNQNMDIKRAYQKI